MDKMRLNQWLPEYVYIWLLTLRNVETLHRLVLWELEAGAGFQNESLKLEGLEVSLFKDSAKL